MREIKYKFAGEEKVFRFSESGSLRVDLMSIGICERAKQITVQDKISFGEALKKARREVAADPHFAETNGFSAGTTNFADWDNGYVEISFDQAMTRFSELVEKLILEEHLTRASAVIKARRMIGNQE
jgi:hypothetical protein